MGHCAKEVSLLSLLGVATYYFDGTFLIDSGDLGVESCYGIDFTSFTAGHASGLCPLKKVLYINKN